MAVVVNECETELTCIQTLIMDGRGNIASVPVYDKLLLPVVYPGCEVLRVQLPRELMGAKHMVWVEGLIKDLIPEGWLPIESRSAAKKEQMYFVNAQRCTGDKVELFALLEHSRAFRDAVEALIHPCAKVVSLPDTRILIVADGHLAVGSQGWVRQALCPLLGLANNAVAKFVMSFKDVRAQGALKVMPEDVAAYLEADLVIPLSVLDMDRYPEMILIENEYRFRGGVALGIAETPGSYETAVSGVLKVMPASVIAGDSYLFLDSNGVPDWDHGWIPTGLALGVHPSDCAYKLMPESFRALKFFSGDTAYQLLKNHLQHASQVIPDLERLVDLQLLLDGAWVLHPETAEQIRELC